MNKILTFAVVSLSVAYYMFLPFVVANADSAAVSQVPDPAPSAILYMRVTAYSSVPDQTDDTPFTTADGSHVADGIAASNILPFGTEIKIPALFGDKVFVIHDRTSPRFSHTIDLWMSSTHKAIVFGVSHATVVVLGKAPSTLSLANTK